MPQLSQRHCEAMKAGVAPLGRARAEQMLSEVKGWALSEDAKELSQTFKFKNYYETMAFVNALAWIAHREDHHPDIEVGYNRCRIHRRADQPGRRRHHALAVVSFNALFHECRRIQTGIGLLQHRPHND